MTRPNNCCLLPHRAKLRPAHLFGFYFWKLSDIFSKMSSLSFFYYQPVAPKMSKILKHMRKIIWHFFFLCNFKGAMTLYLPWQVTAIRGTLIGWHNSDGRGGREGEEGRCRALSSLCNICIQAAGTSDFIRYVDRLSLYIPCSSYIYTHFSEKVQPLHVLNRTNIYTR